MGCCPHLHTLVHIHTCRHIHSLGRRQGVAQVEYFYDDICRCNAHRDSHHWGFSSFRGTRRVCPVWGWGGKLTLGNSPEAFLQTLNGRWVPALGTQGPAGGSVQFSSVTQSCLTLCDPMDCSMPGLPVHHQLPEFTQTHVHRVGDAIQPSHPLSSPSPPAFNLSHHQGLFQ